jgi:hypothetical protein
MRLPSAVVLAAALVQAMPAAAQSSWTYRARVSLEAQQNRINPSSPLVPGGSRTWDASDLFLAAGDSSWNSGGRLKLGAGLIVSGTSGTNVRVTAREAYARVSATSWMDLEAGKRLVRWGVGYGFSPTGVLDPPRRATDPTDRLGRNEGVPLARIDVFRGDTSVTVAVADPALWRAGVEGAAPSRMMAARFRTVLRGGLEVALVGSAARGRRGSFGGSVTHVAGQRLEWHGELLASDTAGQRTLSGVAGAQYTLAGLNVVMEYHRDRANRLFLRAARSAADVRVAPEFIVIRGLDDRAWTLVAGLGWTPRPRLDVYARATRLAGEGTSRLAPVRTALTLGTTVRF